jgi:hypothetical protein
MRLSHGVDAGGEPLTAPAPVTRLTLVTTIEAGDWAVELPRPTFLRVGESVWIQGPTLYVRRPDGDVTHHKGDGFWLCRW